jgi:hypothetical protein
MSRKICTNYSFSHKTTLDLNIDICIALRNRPDCWIMAGNHTTGAAMTQQNQSGTTGIGDDDLDDNGQADATPDMAETGGSGGAGLTRSDGDGAPEAAPAAPLHPATQSGALGAEDTRPEQAGVNETGLGSAETGANQAQDDMAPASRAPGA